MRKRKRKNAEYGGMIAIIDWSLFYNGILSVKAWIFFFSSRQMKGIVDQRKKMRFINKNRDNIYVEDTLTKFTMQLKWMRMQMEMR